MKSQEPFKNIVMSRLWWGRQGLNLNNIKRSITMFLLQFIAGSDMQLQCLDTFHDCFGIGSQSRSANRDHKLSGN